MRIMKPISGLWFMVLFVLCTVAVSAQTFPSATSCTSKDLVLVAATLPSTPCETCNAGDSIYKMLTVAINNKTGSTRTSFAFWATLVILNANGDTASKTAISKCFSTIPKNATTSYPYGNLGYKCGQSLILTDIWEAWTDASPGSTCPVLMANTSTINPKCGTNPKINIVGGVDANIDITRATCITSGSITVSPFGGSGQPYAIALYNGTTKVDTASGIAAGGSKTFSNLAAATYTIKLYDKNNCSNPVIKTRALESSSAPTAPTNGGNQSPCQQSPIQTLTATATAPAGSSVVWYDASTGGNIVASPTLNSVNSVTYYAASKDDITGCFSSTRTPVTLQIKGLPNAPVSGGNQSPCAQSPVQKLTATATVPSGSVVWYDASTSGNIVNDPSLNSVGTVTYYAEAVGSNGCHSLSRTAVTLTIKATPSAPTADVTQPTCSTNTGTITVTSGITGLSFSINSTNPADFTNTTGIFGGLAAGDYIIRAKNSDGCISGGVTKTVNAAPAGPTFTVTITQPDLCNKGSLVINASGGSNFQYTIDGGTHWQSSSTFSDLITGSVTGVQVQNGAGCFSGTQTCAQVSAGISNKAKPEPILQVNNNDDIPSVLAYPNPFNDHVKFMVNAPKAGNGSLEVYNIMGQKIRTVYQGHINAGSNSFEFSIPKKQQATLIYLLKVGDKKVTGKLLQLNN
jgi:hypothetical protein